MSELEGKWEEAPLPKVRQLYIESAKVGIDAADELLFSEEAVLRVAKMLFIHTISDNAGATAPDTIAECESAARAVLSTLKKLGNE
jgi:hypothetical protein